MPHRRRVGVRIKPGRVRSSTRSSSVAIVRVTLNRVMYKSSIKFLGHIIDKGIRADPDKTWITKIGVKLA